jgi:hypothetical protein
VLQVSQRTLGNVQCERIRSRAAKSRNGTTRDAPRVRVLWCEGMGRGEMAGQLLGDVLVGQALEPPRRREVQRAPLGPRQRSVGDFPDEILEEGDLAAPRRLGLLVECEELTTDQRPDAIVRGRGVGADGQERIEPEAAPEYRGREQKPPLRRGQCVDSRRKQPVQRVGHRELQTGGGAPGARWAPSLVDRARG